MGFGSRIHHLFNNGHKEPSIRLHNVAPPDANILTPIRYSVKSRKAAWISGSLVGFFLTSTLVASIALRMEENAGEATEFRQFYITDAWADLDELRITLSKVEVCDGQALHLVRDQFDLLKFRGPENALLVAEGFARPCADASVSITFDEVVGCSHGQCAELRIDDAVLTVEPESSVGANVLVDIDVEASVKATPPPAGSGPVEPGAASAAFAPEVKAVYTKDAASAYADWKAADFESDLAAQTEEPEPSPVIYTETDPEPETSAPAPTNVAPPDSRELAPTPTLSAAPAPTTGAAVPSSAPSTSLPTSPSATPTPSALPPTSPICVVLC